MATPVATGPATLSTRAVCCTHAASRYCTTCQRATPHMSTAFATCPEG
jgi:hypothetical protein